MNLDDLPEGLPDGLGDILKKIIRVTGGSVEDIPVENEMSLEDGAVKEVWKEIMDKHREANKMIQKVNRLKKEMDLLQDDIWEHAASCFGFETITDLHEAGRSMRIDHKKGKVYLHNGSEGEDKE